MIAHDVDPCTGALGIAVCRRERLEGKQLDLERRDVGVGERAKQALCDSIEASGPQEPALGWRAQLVVQEGSGADGDQKTTSSRP